MFDHPLEERCYQFAKRTRAFCRRLKWDVINVEDIKQLVRSSGSVPANYIEANENLGPNDLRMRLKICRKEAKESANFFGLLETFSDKNLEEERQWLIGESIELRKIFSTMINKLG